MEETQSSYVSQVLHLKLYSTFVKLQYVLLRCSQQS